MSPKRKSVSIPITQAELLVLVARETARMSYPGSMSRGVNPVVSAGTKTTLEEYFAGNFDLKNIRNLKTFTQNKYDSWHKTKTGEIARRIQNLVHQGRNPQAVATKFLNTFMHQLMKHEDYRVLYPFLHLPLDRRVFDKLRSIRWPSLPKKFQTFTCSPYSLSYKKYSTIQTALCALVCDLNKGRPSNLNLRSRIDLNWLWV